MKIVLILINTLLLLSCNQAPTQHVQDSQADENWEIQSQTFTVNNYTSNGLLDTSFATTISYYKGLLMDTVKSFKVKYYNKKNMLIDEKNFDIEKNALTKISGETISEYDDKGNIISEIYKLDGYILTKKTDIYNTQNQEVKSIFINKKTDEPFNDPDLDSPAIHMSDKKHFQYDTTIDTFEYDVRGNCTRSFKYDMRGNILSTLYYIYSGKEQVKFYEISFNGDTASSSHFEHDGNIIKQITQIKKINTIDTVWTKNGKPIKMISYYGKWKSKCEYKYDEKGNEIENDCYE